MIGLINKFENAKSTFVQMEIVKVLENNLYDENSKTNITLSEQIL